MNKLYTLLLLIVVTLSAKGQANDAEVFVEVRDPGRYTVSIDDEFTGSTSGRFRFFELKAGNILLTISSNGQQLFSDNINVMPGDRNIFTYSKKDGLKRRSQLQIYNNGAYALDNWNGYSRDNNNDNSQVNNPRRPSIGWRMPPAINQQQLSRLVQSIKSEPFDADKYKLLVLGTKGSALYVNQLCEILKAFSFDDKKIDAAIYAYDHVLDASNFYVVRDLFTFQSSKDKIDQFMLKQ